MFDTWLMDCTGRVLTEQGGIIATLFLAGLAGGMTHCLGMCSPFLLALQARQTQPAVSSAALAKLLLPYHAGRIVTYTLIGVASAAASAQLASFSGFKHLAAILLVLAGIVFLASAFAKFLGQRCWVPSSITRRLHSIFQRYGTFGAGLLLGFLPCGLVYAALLAVASTQQPLVAAFGMAAFGLGTMPSLVLASLGLAGLRLRYAVLLPNLARGLAVLNAFILFRFAGGLLS